MATTEGIYYPTTSSTSGYVTETAAVVSSLASTRTIKSFKWADATARAAQTGMSEGDIGDQADNDITWRYSGSAWVPLLLGSFGVIPTVSGSGVSVDSTTGVVTFTSATTVTIDGLTSDYNAFEVDFSCKGTAANATMVLRTTGSADVTTSTYDQTELLGRNGTATSSTSASGTSWTLIGFSNVRVQVGMKIASLAQAVETSVIMNAAVHSNPAVSNTANGVNVRYLTHQSATAYGGFKITFSAAQTGTLRVRGVR